MFDLENGVNWMIEMTESLKFAVKMNFKMAQIGFPREFFDESILVNLRKSNKLTI